MKIIHKLSLIIFLIIFTGMSGLFYASYVKQKDQRIDAEISKARALVLEAEAVREAIAEANKLGIYDQAVARKDIATFLHTVPIAVSMGVLGAKTEQINVKLKVPKISPRNPVNEPDPTDLKVLKMFEEQDTGTGNTPEYHVVDKDRDIIRYYKAVRLTKECENCHGDPATSMALWGNDQGLDPTGVRMENWRAGEIHGAFEIMLPLSPIIKAARIDALQNYAVLIIVTVVLLLFMMFTTKKLIFNPLKDVNKMLAVTAGGDFSKHKPTTRTDEIGDVYKAFDMMIASMRSALETITESINNLASTSAELFSTSENIARGAASQSEEADTTIAAVEEVNATVIEVSKNAYNVAQSAQSAKDSAENSNSIVADTRAMMEQIANTVTKTAAMVKELGESSIEIGNIIQVINEIADQTNLLALNAAIEAARAGEHGKGFAVVADEVRKLAEKTTTATKQITEMIKSIQTDTNSAVSGMQDGVKKVDIGKTKAEEASQSLRKTLAEVENVSSEVSLIANATNEQAKAIDLMAHSIESISNVTKENSTAASESALAVGQLNRLASDLQALVGKFKL